MTIIRAATPTTVTEAAMLATEVLEVLVVFIELTVGVT
jgi:hypothetical protein